MLYALTEHIEKVLQLAHPVESMAQGGLSGLVRGIIVLKARSLTNNKVRPRPLTNLN